MKQKFLANNNGFTVIEGLLIALIISILVLIMSPNMIRARMRANDSNARSTLRTLSEAVKMYRVSTTGQFPTNITVLLNTSNGFLKEDYCGTTENGYIFTCTFGSNSYSFQATPVNFGLSGTTTYTITTGGVLRP
jgi:competence protein ComGC